MPSSAPGATLTATVNSCRGPVDDFFFFLPPAAGAEDLSFSTPTTVAESWSQSNQTDETWSSDRPRIVVLKSAPCCPPKGKAESNSGSPVTAARTTSQSDAAIKPVERDSLIDF